MKVLLSLLILGVIVALGIYLWRTITANRPKHSGREKDWERAAGGGDITSNPALLKIARPFASLPAVYDENSALYRAVQERLVAAGGLFGGSAEVFLAVQSVGVVAGLVALLLALGDLIPLLLAIPFTLIVLVGPYTVLDSRSKRRTVAVTKALPEYAELLQIPIGAGKGVLQSLTFLSSPDSTQRRVNNIVSDEVAAMLANIKTRAVSEEEAFVLAGERLATPEAKVFFNTLLQAHLRGAQLADNIAKQAASLRVTEFQRQRADAKRMPVKLVVVFAVFFLPFLFTIVLLPVVFSLRGLT
jgi:Flp pilus assembly protein TadB